MSTPEQLRDLSNQIASQFIAREAIAAALRLIADHIQAAAPAPVPEKPVPVEYVDPIEQPATEPAATEPAGA